MKQFLARYWPWFLVPVLVLAALLAVALTRSGSPLFGYHL